MSPPPVLLNMRTSKPRLNLLGHAHFPTRVPGECVHWQYEGRRGRPDPVNVEPHWRGALSGLCCCEGVGCGVWGGLTPVCSASVCLPRLASVCRGRLLAVPTGWHMFVCEHPKISLFASELRTDFLLHCSPKTAVVADGVRARACPHSLPLMSV